METHRIGKPSGVNKDTVLIIMSTAYLSRCHLFNESYMSDRISPLRPRYRLEYLFMVVNRRTKYVYFFFTRTSRGFLGRRVDFYFRLHRGFFLFFLRLSRRGENVIGGL